MRDLEAKSETLGISTNELMDNAGFSIASHIAKKMGPLKGLKVVSLVGTGNREIVDFLDLPSVTD